MALDLADIIGIPAKGEVMGMLARNNINIMDITDEYIFLEFQFRMADGRPKWARTVYRRKGIAQFDDELMDVIDEVRGARKWAETVDHE